MDKLKYGLIDLFTGKLYHLITGELMGKVLIDKNAKLAGTPAKIHQAQILLYVQSILAPLRSYFDIGFVHRTQRQIPIDLALQASADAFSGAHPNFKVDYSKLVISQGLLPLAVDPNMHLSDNRLMIYWGTMAKYKDGNEHDELILAVYNEYNRKVKGIGGGVLRDDMAFEFLLGEDMMGARLHVYIAFRSKKGTDVSCSQYLGSVNS